MANPSPARKPVKPSGSCRWLRRIDDTKTGLLEINGQLYGVVAVDGGYQLVKPDGTVYDVDGTTWSCTCPDATWRQRECKHAKALRAALAAAAGQ
jgi:hypothetical protein